MIFSRDELLYAREADLYQYLLDNHDDEFYKEGASLRMRNEYHHNKGTGIVITRGFAGYYDWSPDDETNSGNSVDFLVKHMDYSLPEAVKALCEYDCIGYGSGASFTDNAGVYNKPLGRKERMLVKPEKADSYRHTYAYLVKQRGIPVETVQMLIDEGLLYQEKEHNNMVFISYDGDAMEIRGTNSFFKFRQTRRVMPDRFWQMGKTGTLYLTEASIDAVSLYELRNREPAIYASMAGCENQQIIDRIVADGRYHVVLAVDNDDAGQRCRDRNPDLEYLIPDGYKDWNEQLLGHIQ